MSVIISKLGIERIEYPLFLAIQRILLPFWSTKIPFISVLIKEFEFNEVFIELSLIFFEIHYKFNKIKNIYFDY